MHNSSHLWRNGSETQGTECLAAKSLQSCLTLCDPIDSHRWRGLSQGSSPGECPSCLPRASTRGACYTTAGLLLIDGVGGAVIQQRRISGFSHQPGQGRGSPEPPKAFLELVAGCAACSVRQPGWGRTKLRQSTPCIGRYLKTHKPPRPFYPSGSCMGRPVPFQKDCLVTRRRSGPGSR